MSRLTQERIDQFRSETEFLRNSPETSNMRTSHRIRDGVAELAQAVLNGEDRRPILAEYFPTASLRIVAGAMMHSMFDVEPRRIPC